MKEKQWKLTELMLDTQVGVVPLDVVRLVYDSYCIKHPNATTVQQDHAVTQHLYCIEDEMFIEDIDAATDTTYRVRGRRADKKIDMCVFVEKEDHDDVVLTLHRGQSIKVRGYVQSLQDILVLFPAVILAYQY